MLTDAVEAPSALPFTPVKTRPGEAELDQLEALLNAAKKPFAILGGTRWSPQAVQQMEHIAESWALPVGCSFRRQMLFDHCHENYAGDVGIGLNPKLAARVKEADLILLIGGRFGEMPSSDYTLMKSPYPDQKLVHVHADANELGRVYRPTLAINASPAAFVEAFAKRKGPAAPGWAGETKQAHADYLAWSTPPKSGPGAVHMGPIVEYLEGTLPQDAVICNGAGNFATWMHRFHRYRRYGTQAAPTSGSMGYGLPAGVGAKSVFPDREVIVWAGDGDFLMHGQEFSTAVQYDLPIVVVILNNGIYGTIRMHQEREYPGRVSGTMLKNPDFAAYARAFGGHGETVEKTEDFAAAFERARASGKPAIIEVKLDPEAITPTRTLTQIREGR
jgi:acetolactate synthase-1/2/3 large subunit